MARWLVTLLLVSASIACGDDGGAATADASFQHDAPIAPIVDANPNAPDSDLLPRVVIPATDGVLDLDYSVAISGTGQSRVAGVSITNATGTVNISGDDYDVVVYEMQPWPAFGYTLFQTLAVKQDNWYVIWFYCEGSSLTGLYSESVDGAALSYEAASGTCSFDSTPSQAQVQFPQVRMVYPDLEAGFTFSGTELNLQSGATGSVRLGADDLQILPFERVDCTTECGGAPGWWELHAVLYDQANGRACFAIFYMFPDRPSQVDLTYSLTLPDLSDPAGYTSFDATWTAP